MISLKKNNKVILYSASAVIMLLLIFFSFYKFGFLRYYDLSSQKNELLEKIKETDETNKNLELAIDSLNNSNIKIEKVAREKYHMVKRGEKIFEIRNKD